VVALVPRPQGSESEQGLAPPTEALLAAIQYAHARGVTIGANAVWSDQPALDIITAAQEARVSWILLGYHRGAFGKDTMGGVVREVFARAKSLTLNVGVFVQGTDRPIERVHAAVDSSPDGQAALQLALRIARKQNCKLRALLVSNRMAHTHPEEDLVEMVRDARNGMGSMFHTDVLTERSLHQLLRQTPGRLLIVGRKFAEEVSLPLDEVPGGDRCVIVVHGSENQLPKDLHIGEEV